jgi:ABC1 atypical kinase-like domain
VHHAVLADGTEVAVKVQRPSLDRQVYGDLGVARLDGPLRRALRHLGAERAVSGWWTMGPSPARSSTR